MADSAKTSFPHIKIFFIIYLYTVIQTSGHTMAQKLQPVHLFSLSENKIGFMPFSLVALLGAIHPFGQYKTQSSHPLQVFVLISTFGISQKRFLLFL